MEQQDNAGRNVNIQDLSQPETDLPCEEAEQVSGGSLLINNGSIIDDNHRDLNLAGDADLSTPPPLSSRQPKG